MAVRKPLGLVAGSGKLPVALAREVEETRRLIVASFAREPNPELARRAARFERVGVGQLRAMFQLFEAEKVEEILFLGGAAKETLFQPYRLDRVALKILMKSKRRGDQALFHAIAEEFEAQGFRILDQRTFLGALLPDEGPLTRRRISRRVEDDIRYAFWLARSIAALDVGQTVVVKQGVPLAIEAIEGTNAAIRRGGKLGGKGVVVAKATSPEHDFRFDVPTVGLETLALLREVGAAALALEAGGTFLLDRAEFLREAHSAGIAVVGLSGDNLAPS